MKTAMMTNTAKRQRGLTLVEIMVAVTISLVLLAGVLQVFLSSKASYNLQNGIARLHENARFALDIMTNNISRAGYADLSMAGPTLNAINTANTQNNVTANAALGFSVANNRASDTISVNYQATQNCAGVAVATATDRYYLDGSNLMCIGNGDADNPVIIAEGVENLQILYGIDTDADADGIGGDRIANTYVSAANIASEVNVVSVRIAILVNSVDSVSSGTDSNLYTLLNAPPLGPFNDTLYRRTFTRTIMLRNRAPS